MIEVNAGLVVLLAFLLLVLLRVPIWLALIVPSISYLVLYGYPLSFPTQRLVQSINTFTLLAIPMFILVGNIMNESGVTDTIFEFANDIVGHVEGGLAQVNIIASLIFSGMSGSALADIGGIGQVLINSMVANGYDRSFAASVTSASATVGPIFPPSIPIIVYGLVAEVSVLDLLIAGIGPALLVVAFLMIGTYVIVRRNPDLISVDEIQIRSSPRQLLWSFTKATPALATPIVLIAGMLTGYFGATEVAAVTVLYVIGIGILFYGSVGRETLWTAGRNTVYTSAAIMIIVAAAGLFSFIMSIEGVDDLMASFIFGVTTNPILALLLVNVFLILIGLFIEPIAAIVMSVPIVVPPLVELGVDPVHIGIVMVFNLMIGLLTPPLGLSLFICEDIAKVPVKNIIHRLLPYYFILLACLVVVTVIPEVSLFLLDR